MGQRWVSSGSGSPESSGLWPPTEHDHRPQLMFNRDILRYYNKTILAIMGRDFKVDVSDTRRGLLQVSAL